MKTLIEKSTRLAVTILLIMVVTIGYSQGGKDNRKQPTQSHEQMAPSAGPETPPMPPQQHGMSQDMPAPPSGADLPGLTDEQKDKIRKSDLKRLETMTPLRNQMREKRARLATILSTPPADLKEADLVADEIGKLQASILRQQIRHDQEIRSFLTPDQQILFDARPKPFLEKANPGMKMRKGKNMPKQN